MNAKISVIAICVKMIINLLLYDLSFNEKASTHLQLWQRVMNIMQGGISCTVFTD